METFLHSPELASSLINSCPLTSHTFHSSLHSTPLVHSRSHFDDRLSPWEHGHRVVVLDAANAAPAIRGAHEGSHRPREARPPRVARLVRGGNELDRLPTIQNFSGDDLGAHSVRRKSGSEDGKGAICV